MKDEPYPLEKAVLEHLKQTGMISYFYTDPAARVRGKKTLVVTVASEDMVVVLLETNIADRGGAA